MMRETTFSKPIVGIDDMELYIPSLFLPIEILAKKRNIDFGKLHHGLGLQAMAVPDVHEDAATMAANAILRLILKNQINPNAIGRIYLGTESALDDSKPTASYALDMLNDYFSPEYGEDCFLNCDVVDLNFACIGGVDALQNTLDWVTGDSERIGIVVTSDIAKYELGSSGEYTQGAGAIAILVKQNPRLLAIYDIWGIGTRPVHDFFKPKRLANKSQIVKEVLEYAGINGVNPSQILDNIDHSLSVNGILDCNESMITIHKQTPVFDGPYSNQCYQDRIKEAFENFSKKASKLGMGPNGQTLTEYWERMVFHLPYAYQGRRMFAELFFLEAKAGGRWESIQHETGLIPPPKEQFENEQLFLKAYSEFLRLLSKSNAYKIFVSRKIEKGERASSQIGNMYTGSIFLSLMSTLFADFEEGVDLNGKNIGFFAYGSGSKSKVFEGRVLPQWQSIVERFNLTKVLSERKSLDYYTYEQLHRGNQVSSVTPPKAAFSLKSIADSGPLIGQRTYHWLTTQVEVSL
jgi:hydroxymethylglutaryl-CoA synthase